MKHCIIAIFACAMILTGCQTTGDGTNNQTQQQAGKVIGALIGAAAGAFLGSKVGGGRGRTGAMVIGALAGAMIGSAIFASLSAQDKESHANTRLAALEEAKVGEWKEWENPNAETGGLTRIDRDFTGQNGNDCRETMEGVITPEGKETNISTYCKNSDTGEWEVAEGGGKKGAWQSG